MTESEIYWTGKLANAPLTLEFPVDRLRPSTPSQRIARHSFTLAPDLVATLLGLGARESAAPFLTLLAGFAALLQRYTGEEDLLIAIPGEGRTPPNTLVLRAQFSGEISFRLLLAQIRQAAMEAYAHQDLPFDEIVPTGISVALNFQTAAPPTHPFDLTLAVPGAGHLSPAAFEYNPDLFDPTTIERLAEHLRVLLEGAVAKPDLPIALLPVLTGAEQQTILQEWGTAKSGDTPALHCLHELFEAHVRENPGALALTVGDRNLTYEEVNRSADLLARRLITYGVGAETLVAIYMERSPELVIALLAILKAGGAYVPLDPEYPRDRVAFILQDAGVRLVLATAQTSSTAGTLGGQAVQVVLVDGGAESAETGGAVPDSLVTPSNAAYVIYTSGSTGRPKGVVVTHANVARLLTHTAGLFNLGPSDVWTLFHSFAFDFSVWEIWGALAFGGRLVVVPQQTSRSPAEFWNLLDREKVTVLNHTPSAFSALVQTVEEMAALSLPDLRLVIFGGEALEFRSLRPWARRFGLDRPALVNMYGITETTVHVTHHRISENDLNQFRSIVGRPIDDLSAYILDPHMHSVPVGVTGELYVGGAGVARGYLNRPDLTAERFVADPFSAAAGARLYRTGDVARYLPDGNIEYRGRIDQQVKIRGFRIEPGEVEAALARHPAVRECRVVAREDAPGDKRLVGYVVVAAGIRPTGAKELRQHLSTRLPDYMVPSAFVWLDALPLTPNGKLDRAALPAPSYQDRLASPETTGPAAPQTPAEERLAGIARKLLNLTALGCEEDFFDLGMHSLLAGRMAAMIQRQLHVGVCVKDTFETRTVRALARRLYDGDTSIVEKPIPRAGHRDNIPLTWQQEQIFFLTKLAPDSLAYNSQITLRLRGQLNGEALVESLDRIVERHEIFRTTFHDGPSGPVQTVHPPWKVQVEIVDFSQQESGAREQIAEQAIQKAIRHTFDTSRLPLVKWTLYRLAPDDHVLLHVEHHLIHDGWEVAVLLRELQEIYTAAVEHRPAALEELPIQYADYALWQRSYLSGERLEGKVRYWEQRLRDYPRVLNLATDHERPVTQSFRGAALRADMDRTLYAALREFSRQRKVTLFVTMYSAFAVLLARYTGQKRLLVGTGVANRSRWETQGLLGMFVNAVALTAELTGDPTFEEVLAATQRTMIEDGVHHDTPFTELVRRLGLGQVRDRNPLVQVLFAFHDSAVPVPEFAGLKGTVVERHNGTAKMDMNVLCVPRAEQRAGQRSEQAGEEDLTLIWEYNSDLFEKPTIERMLGHYLHLLDEVLRSPNAKVSALEIVPVKERSRILRDFSPPPVEYDRDSAVWDLFTEVAERQPEKPAIVAPGKSVTYAELAANARRVAAALAQALDGKPLAPGFPVALCVPRGAAMIAGMLGILRAGGAYVPVPPTYPRERIRLMLEDSDAAAVIVQESGRQAMDSVRAENRPVIDLETVLNSGNPASDLPVCAHPSGESAAYIIYTSGSTGTPKGAVVPHRAIHNLVLSLRRDLQNASDVVAQLADSAFDATIFEIWGTLLTGGTIAIVDAEAVGDPERLEHVLRECQVTVAFFTTSLFNVIADVRPQAIARLRNVAVGGEKVSLAAIERVMTQRPGAVRVWHVYGPTESTCFSAGFLCTLAWLKKGLLPLGKPLINYSAYVLDGNRNLAPVGVPGELYIGGDGLAIGYLNQPELTAERFVPNPFASPEDRRKNRNLRLYRTGDSVRWLEDGNIEFLGRLDAQLKVRGFRVEPGEIEAALGRHPAVNLTAVTVREQAGGEKQLVAWVTLASGALAHPEELRRFLQQTLPPHMIPSRVMVLDRFPLTASGKIDRRALPEPPLEAAVGSKQEVANPLTAQLAQIWEELLGVQPIGLRQDFFALGGHSLLAVRMVSRVAELLGRQVPVSMLFAAPTIGQLATALVEEHRSDLPLIQVQTGTGRRPIFFFDGDWLGNGLYCRILARLTDRERPFYTLSPHGVNGKSVPSSIEAMAADRLDALLAAPREGPFLLGGYCVGGLVALETARQLEARGHAVDLVILLDSVADSASGIPWRRWRRWFLDLNLRGSSFAAQWNERDWRGRSALVGESIKRLFVPSETIPPAAASPEAWTMDWSRGAPAEYLRSLWRYRLKPYSGKVAVLFTKDSKWALNPELPWRKVASNLDVHWISGDHTTALAAHIAETGAAIRAALARAESKLSR